MTFYDLRNSTGNGMDHPRLFICKLLWYTYTKSRFRKRIVLVLTTDIIPL